MVVIKRRPRCFAANHEIFTRVLKPVELNKAGLDLQLVKLANQFLLAAPIHAAYEDTLLHPETETLDSLLDPPPSRSQVIS